MINTSYPAWPSFTEDEVEIVSKILRSNKVNYWTGEQCEKFEHEFAEYFGSKYAISLTNGTAAIELALSAIGIGSGDEVVVTPRSYVASVSPVVMSGAVPVFADVDRDSQCLTAESISSVLTNKTRAVIVVHLGGYPAEMDEIVTLAKERNLKIIEDCAQAHGALYRGKSVGTFGDIASWSFCQDKIMTTGGEGGMVTTDNEEYWMRMWALKDHGKNLNLVHSPREVKNKFRWLHDSFGSNHRMTEMQAGIGRYQLGRMNQWHQARLSNANQIWRTCEQLKWLRCPMTPEYSEHAAYKAYVFVNLEQLPNGWSRDRVINELGILGVPCYSGGCPEIYNEKAFDTTGWRPKDRLPVAKELGESSIMFLVHPTLEKINIDHVCESLVRIDQMLAT